MLIKLHCQATTPSKTRAAAIPASDEPARILAAHHGTTEPTVYKWKKRNRVADQSHTTHRLNPPDAGPGGDRSGLVLRKTLLVSRDDILTAPLAVVGEFLNPNLSRSGLDRCLRRHRVGNLRALKAAAPRPQPSASRCPRRQPQRREISATDDG